MRKVAHLVLTRPVEAGGPLLILPQPYSQSHASCSLLPFPIFPWIPVRVTTIAEENSPCILEDFFCPGFWNRRFSWVRWDLKYLPYACTHPWHYFRLQTVRPGDNHPLDWNSTLYSQYGYFPLLQAFKWFFICFLLPKYEVPALSFPSQRFSSAPVIHWQPEVIIKMIVVEIIIFINTLANASVLQYLNRGSTLN